MPDYDLSRLSSRSFEQLVQALALKVIGPGVSVFGDGPDGGREATFEGPVRFPDKTEPWRGYGVIQAKFRQRPEGAEKDGKWALKELRGELEKLAKAKGGRRKPEYYIFATNVVLTPVAGSGSKDRGAGLIKEFADRVPLKGYRSWDYDQMCRFLDDLEGIRRGYAAWITPGDVLARVMEWLEPRQADFEQVMANFLQKELLADRFARLEQAGHTTEDRIPLARVFVDLPASPESRAEPPKEQEEELRAGCVTEVLEAGSECARGARALCEVRAQLARGEMRKWVGHLACRLVAAAGDEGGRSGRELPGVRELAAIVEELDGEYSAIEALCVAGRCGGLDEDNVRVFDLAGRGEHAWAPRKVREELTAWLQRAYQSDPSRVGVLRVLSLLAVAGGKPSVPAELLELDRFDEGMFRGAAILVRLAGSDISVGDGKRLGQEAARLCRERAGFGEMVLQVVKKHNLVGSGVDRFLLECRGHLPEERWEVIRGTVGALRESLRRRTSRLRDQEVWSRLGLPKRLGESVCAWTRHRRRDSGVRSCAVGGSWSPEAGCCELVRGAGIGGARIVERRVGD